ncbi:MAG: helix-turn-helix domain-containing protein [Chloroflexales bacterium]
MTTRITLACAELRHLYLEAHLSMAGIAAILGCSAATVANRLRVCGIPTRSGRFQSRPVPYPSLVYLYCEEGLPLAVIAAHFGVSVGTIHNWRRAYGIPARGHRQRRFSA